MPLALSLTAPKKLEPKDRPPLSLKPHEARVALRMAGVCGTDIAIWSGAYPVPLPIVLGHEWVGQVVEVGKDGPQDLVGKRVTGEINNSCLARASATPCEACRRGFPNHCLDRTVTGIVVHDGAFQRELVVPFRILHELPDSIPDDEAFFIEPLAAALQTFELSPVQKGELVVVLGAGRLGVLCALIAKERGARVLAVARNVEREKLLRDLGLETFRVSGRPRRQPSDPLAAARSPLLNAVIKQSKGFGADLVVETTGTAEGLPLALDLVRPRGIVALKSTPGQPVPQFGLTRCVVNEVQLQGSRCGPFDEAIVFQAKHRLPLKTTVAATFPLEDLGAAFERAAETSGKVAIQIAD